MEQIVPCQVFWNKLFYHVSMKKFDYRLRELRTEANMTRIELAEKLHVSVRLISYWETGQRECSFDMLIAIADLFGITVDYLIGRTEY